MKRLFYSFWIFLLFSFSVLAQNEGISFQGLARNAAGEVMVSKKISLRLSILLGSESGAVAYTETRQTTTNPQGIFAVVLGDNTALTKSTNFSTIDWSTAQKFIKVEMDPNAGTNFTAMGTSKLQPVPFAFYAYGVDAGNVDGILPVGSGGTGVVSLETLKTNLSLDQVNNTSDANKPLSAAMQGALSTKVDKEMGKGLSSNDFSTAEKLKLAAITGNVAGPIGPQGPIGLTGPAGATGLTGAIGAVGPIGLTGPAGATGPQGPIGLTGATGPQGPIGLTGPAGNDGAVGPQGATGTQGPIGLTGPVGATGPIGLTGPAGPQGSTGPAGTNGVSASSANFVDLTTDQTIAGVKTFSGNIGMGTSTPSAKLEIVGGTRNDMLRLVSPGNPSVSFKNTDPSGGAANDGEYQLFAAGNSGNPSINPGTFGIYYDHSNNAGYRMAITNTGNVGVGTAKPTEKLDVVGNVKTSGTITAGSITYPNTAGTNGYYLKTDGTGTASWAAVSGAGVPYTGATGAVNLGNYDLTVHGLTVGRGGGGKNSNVAIGISALPSNHPDAAENTAIGYAALINQNSSSARANTATGFQSLESNQSGQENSAFGHNALKTNTASYNTAVGSTALQSNTTGTYNTAIGKGADVGAGNLTNATAIGSGASVAASNTIQLGNTDVSNVNTSGSLTANGVKIGRGLGSISTNTAVGLDALKSNTTGNKNTAIGNQALQANTTGSANTAFGYQALSANTTGSSNVAIGSGALYQSNSIHNVAIGENALTFNNSGSYNIGIGRGTLTQNKSGTENIAIGSEAGYHLNSFSSGSGNGGGNVFIGFQSGLSRNRGSSNTAIGKQSLYSFTVDFYDYSNAVAMGIQSGFTNRTSNNTFLGSFADVDYTTNSSITNATALGYQAKVVASNTIQLGNTAVTNVKTSGTLTAGDVTYPNTHGTANQVLSTTGSGTLAWSTPSAGGVPYTGASQAVNLGAYDLTVNGVVIGKGLNSVASNTRVGSFALQSNTTGSGNDAFGNGSLRDNTVGTGNSAFGMGSLVSNLSGNYNIAIGNNAMMSNATGGQNIAIGVETLVKNTSGNENTAMGFSAARETTTGSANTSIGWRAGGHVTTGAKNIFLGYMAGYTYSTGNTTYNKTGLNSVMIGYDVRPLADGDNNEIVISGYNGSAGTVGLGSNTTLIGSSTTTSARIMGALNLPNTTASSSTTTGALTMAGGVGIAGALNAGGTLTAGTVTYPNTHGTANQVLSTTGSGTLAWTTPASGGGSGVPYTGATQAVDLGTFNLKVNGLSIGVGKANSQTSNTAVGNAALGNNIDGINNVAIGYEALSGELRGGNNVAMGWGALKMNVWGGSNIALGTGALGQNTNGIGNVAIGDAGAYTNGNYNTFIGKGAGNRSSLTTVASNGNVYIGKDVGANSEGSYNIIIGAVTTGGGGAQNFQGGNSINNQIILATGEYGQQRVVFDGTNWLFKYDVLPSPWVHQAPLPNLGSTTVAWPKIYGGTVYANNNVLSSDVRLKSKISPLIGALSSLMQLNPVHYTKKTSLSATAYTLEENGFIAQEIQKILPYLVQEGTDKDKLLSLNYVSLIPLLTKAIQEQQAQIEELQSYKSAISSLQKELEELKKLIKGQ